MTPEDQVPRLRRWVDAHPGWTIRAPFDPLRESVLPHWRATSPDGEVDIFEYNLESLLDRLDKLA